MESDFPQSHGSIGGVINTYGAVGGLTVSPVYAILRLLFLFVHMAQALTVANVRMLVGKSKRRRDGMPIKIISIPNE